MVSLSLKAKAKLDELLEAYKLAYLPTKNEIDAYSDGYKWGYSEGFSEVWNEKHKMHIELTALKEKVKKMEDPDLRQKLIPKSDDIRLTKYLAEGWVVVNFNDEKNYFILQKDFTEYDE